MAREQPAKAAALAADARARNPQPGHAPQRGAVYLGELRQNAGVRVLAGRGHERSDGYHPSTSVEKTMSMCY